MAFFSLNKVLYSRLSCVVFFLFLFFQDHLKAQTTECEQPNVIFCSGFEENPWRAVWSDYDGNPDSTNRVVLDPGPFNTSGNHVMRLRAPSGRGGADLVKVFPQTYDKIYARWYEYWEPGFNFSAPNHGGGLFAGNRNYLGQSDRRPSGSDFVESWFEPLRGRPYLYTYYRGMYMDCADPDGSCWGDNFPCFLDSGEYYCTNSDHRPQPGKMPPLLQDGRWYCIEQMIDLGTPTPTAEDANGVLNFWIDGVEYGPWTGLWFRTTSSVKLSLLDLQLFHHDATHSVEGVFLDDVVISTEPIGCDGQKTLIQPVELKKNHSTLQSVQVEKDNMLVTFCKETKAAISIFNVAGKLMIKRQSQARVFAFNKSDFKTGTYLMKIQTGDVSYIHKVIFPN